MNLLRAAVAAAAEDEVRSEDFELMEGSGGPQSTYIYKMELNGLLHFVIYYQFKEIQILSMYNIHLI